MGKKTYFSEQDTEIKDVFLNKNFVSNHDKQPYQQAAMISRKFSKQAAQTTR